MPVTADDIRIEPWREDDLALLRRQNAPEMTEHLGGPETEQQVLARHQRCLALNDHDDGQMFRMVLTPEGVAEGGIGVWDSDWNGGPAYETGWAVLPEYQGRGIATHALAKVIAWTREQGRFPAVVGFPGVENVASNAVCRKTGFTLLGDDEVEYPKRSFMHCAIWRLVIDDGTEATVAL